MRARQLERKLERLQPTEEPAAATHSESFNLSPGAGMDIPTLDITDTRGLIDGAYASNRTDSHTPGSGARASTAPARAADISSRAEKAMARARAANQVQ